MARPVSSVPGLLRLRGPARLDRRTKNLIKRLRPGDIAVIDHADLDALAARSLAEAGVAAVINRQPFITGRYPNRGPSVLVAANIPLYELSEATELDEVREGELLVIDEGHCLYRNDRPIAVLTLRNEAAILTATQAARSNLGAELEKFARNTLHYLEADKDLLLDPVDVPTISHGKIAGRHALIVVRGEGYKEDLKLLQPYLRDMRPALIAVDGGADALLEMGHRPDIILGDMDSVSDEALGCGAQLIVHAYARRDRIGTAPGLARIESLGLQADLFPVPGTSEDAAMLLAYEHGADLIVAVGTHSNLEDFLEKGRSGMASTFLTRLKIGPRLVDARGVSKLYQPKPPFIAFVALLLAPLFPLVVLLRHSPILQNMVETVRLWWRLHHH